MNYRTCYDRGYTSLACAAIPTGLYVLWGLANLVQYIFSGVVINTGDFDGARQVALWGFLTAIPLLIALTFSLIGTYKEDKSKS